MMLKIRFFTYAIAGPVIKSKSYKKFIAYYKDKGQYLKTLNLFAKKNAKNNSRKIG